MRQARPWEIERRRGGRGSRFYGSRLHKPRTSGSELDGPQSAKDVKIGVEGCLKRHSLSRKQVLCGRMVAGAIHLQIWRGFAN